MEFYIRTQLKYIGFISDSQRNLILQHANSQVFQHSYLSRYITADTQAAYRGLEPRFDVMRIASGMSRTIDKRRPTKLTDAQREQIAHHPELERLRKAADGLQHLVKKHNLSMRSLKGTKTYDDYQKLKRKHRNRQRCLEKSHLAVVKEQFQHEQSVIDVQRQLNGIPIEEEEEKETTKPFALLERERAVSALLAFADPLTEKDHQRRADAITALSTLCELRDFRQSPTTSSNNDHETLHLADTQPSTKSQAKTLSESLTTQCKSTQCIFCLGDEGAPRDQRLREFFSPGDARKHLRRRHLAKLLPGNPILCPHPRCNLTVNSTNEVLNHAEKVHMVSEKTNAYDTKFVCCT